MSERMSEEEAMDKAFKYVNSLPGANELSRNDHEIVTRFCADLLLGRTTQEDGPQTTIGQSLVSIVRVAVGAVEAVGGAVENIVSEVVKGSEDKSDGSER